MNLRVVQRHSNSAVEQAAATAHSWHRKQGAGSTVPARQERAAPPLLTAGVRHMLACQHGSHAEAI
jgi:hypothetical protein